MPSVTSTKTIRWTDNTTGLPVTTGYMGTIKVEEDKTQTWGASTHYQMSYVGDGKYQRSAWAAGAGWYDIYRDAAGVEANAVFFDTMFVNPERRILTDDIDDQQITMGKTDFASLLAGNDATVVLSVFGTNNLFSGKYAGQAVTTGYADVGVGHEALQHLTVAYGDVGIGPYALKQVIDGDHCTAMGAHALENNLHGDELCAFGENALALCLTSYNSAFGALSSDAMTGGLYCSSFGYQSLTTNIAADSNSAFGAFALASAIQQSNTGMGVNAGAQVGSGAFCSFFGKGADVVPGTTLLRSGAFGYNALVGADNCIVLGGTGVDAVKVGIGTTIPTTLLELVAAAPALTIRGSSATAGNYGAAVIESDQSSSAALTLITYSSETVASLFGVAAGNYSFILTGGATSNGLVIGASTANPLILGTNNIERMRIDDSGNITVQEALTLLSDLGTAAELTMLTYDSTAGGTIFGVAAASLSTILSVGASSTGLAIGTATADPLIFGTNNAERFRIAGTGDILASGDSRKLTVQGTLAAAGNYGAIAVQADQGANAELGLVTYNAATVAPIFGLTAGNYSFVHAGGSASNGLGIGTIPAAPLILGTHNLERARFDSNGNFGLGTTTPASKFEMVGATNSVAEIIRNTAATDGYAAILSVRNDNGADAAIDLAAYSSGSTTTTFGQAPANWGILWATGASSNGLMIGTAPEKPIIFGTNNVERARIVSGGNMGLGTTEPGLNVAGGSSDFVGLALHVKSAASAAHLIAEGNVGAWIDLINLGGGADDKTLQLGIWNGVATFRSLKDDLSNQADNVLVMDLGTGYVGIGTATPATQFHSIGTIRADTAFNINGVAGTTGSFTAGVNTVTVVGGIITAIT